MCCVSSELLLNQLISNVDVRKDETKQPYQFRKVSWLSLQLRRMPLVVVPVLAGLVSTVLFSIQGGFGGGHGKFDGLIVALGLPSIYLVQIAPLREWVLCFALTYTVILKLL